VFSIDKMVYKSRGGRGKGRPALAVIDKEGDNWRGENTKPVAKPHASPIPQAADSQAAVIVNSNLALPWQPAALSPESLIAVTNMPTQSAWVPMVDLSAKPTPAGSLFGGSKILSKSGSELPVCLSCKEALSFVCQIERESLLHPFEGKGLVQVFACSKCCANKSIKPRAACWASVISPQDPVELRDLKAPLAKATRRVVKWLPRNDFMHPLEAEENLKRPLTPAEWTALGEAQIRGDKIGGFAPWLNRDSFIHEKNRNLKCKVCETPFRLLLTVDSCDNTALEWGQDGCLMVFECPTHPEQVAALLMST